MLKTSKSQTIPSILILPETSAPNNRKSKHTHQSPIEHIAIMPLLQLNTTQNGPWECDTCCEDYNAKTDQPWETIDDGDLVCTTCIKQQFERALEFDYNWPARWGGEELMISDFESVFSPELVSQVREKAAEMAAVDKDALLEAVKDLTRGKDYQICRPFIQRFGALYVDSWAYTLAMQSLRDDEVGQNQLRQVQNKVPKTQDLFG